MKLPCGILLCIIWLIVGCQNTPTQRQITTADLPADKISKRQEAGVKMIPIQTDFGKFEVFTKKVGNNPDVKILLLHGGPALTHEYMECFQDHLPSAGYEIYFYDQLGSYYSDQPQNDSLWTIPRFVEEVEQVRKALGMNKDNFYIIGNSWGGMLGMEYALKYQQNLKALIVSNMMGSIPDYDAYNGTLRAQMRKSLVDTLESFEKKGDYKNPIYTDLVMKEYYTQHICRLNPWPEALTRSFNHINDPVYVLMQGPNEFKVGGRITHWDIMSQLPSIQIPTLMIGSKYDTMDPLYMEKMSKLTPNGRYLYCPNGSHLSMWDDAKVYYDGIIQFIEEVDK
jgi:proline iminopeptidase